MDGWKSEIRITFPAFFKQSNIKKYTEIMRRNKMKATKQRSDILDVTLDKTGSNFRILSGYYIMDTCIYCINIS